jgi:multidrug efflux pump subunit AcrA (membrane-fusion protein)
MKGKFIICLLVIGLVLGGCGGKASTTPTTAPTISLDSGTGNSGTSAGNTSGTSFTASGVIVPKQEAEIGYLSSGSLAAVNISLGDQVSEGQVLAVMNGKEQAQADLSQAKQVVQAAQNDLDKINREAGAITAQAQTDLLDKADTLKDKKDKDTYIKHLKWLKDRNIALSKAVRKNGYSYPDATDIAKADAELALAQAEYDAAAKHLDDVKNGPDPAVLNLAKVSLKSAQDSEAAAQARLDDMDIKAPFAGIVSAINVSAGDLVTPGQVLFVVTDATNLYVETTDLSERDVPGVSVGKGVVVWVKPLSKELPGKVKAISSRADSVGGDVVYKVQITLESVPAEVRAGMSVEVRFNE